MTKEQAGPRGFQMVGQARDPQGAPPGLTFGAFVLSLSASATMHLGPSAQPAGGESAEGGGHHFVRSGFFPAGEGTVEDGFSGAADYCVDSGAALGAEAFAGGTPSQATVEGEMVWG